VKGRRVNHRNTESVNCLTSDCPQIIQDLVKFVETNTSSLSALPSELLALGEALGGGAGHTFNEDCLTLNVWTKPQIGEQKKAVMVWIYGGG
jgi:Carboxylesterase family